MPGVALTRSAAATFWELRGAWATGRRVALTLTADIDRVEGHVSRVSATDAFVTVGDVLIPADVILAVHRPSRLVDSTVRPDEQWSVRGRRPVVADGQGELPFTAQ